MSTGKHVKIMSDWIKIADEYEMRHTMCNVCGYDLDPEYRKIV